MESKHEAEAATASKRDWTDDFLAVALAGPNHQRNTGRLRAFLFTLL
jgi:hypothetical protein